MLISFIALNHMLKPFQRYLLAVHHLGERALALVIDFAVVASMCREELLKVLKKENLRSSTTNARKASELEKLMNRRNL